MIEQIDFLKDQIPIPRKMHCSPVALIDLSVDEGSFPHSHVQMFVAHSYDLPPVDGGAAVEVHPDVRVFPGLLEVVAAEVAGRDGLDEGPPRRTQVGGGIELQGGPILPCEAQPVRHRQTFSSRIPFATVERLLEIGVEDEDFVLGDEGIVDAVDVQLAQNFIVSPGIADVVAEAECFEEIHVDHVRSGRNNAVDHVRLDQGEERLLQVPH